MNGTCLAKNVYRDIDEVFRERNDDALLSAYNSTSKLKAALCRHDDELQKTIDEVVYGSSLPLSIIIVGVGQADFSAMDELDADEVPLYSQKYKKQMAADIVQFVPFRDFAHNPMQLAKETLEEVPG